MTKCNHFHSACNGTIIQDPDMGEVIQLQGDHRTKVMGFITSKEKMGKYAIPKDLIKVCLILLICPLLFLANFYSLL